MGAGKTTVGRALARRLRRPYSDLDREVEHEAGRADRRAVRAGGRAGLPRAARPRSPRRSSAARTHRSSRSAAGRSAIPRRARCCASARWWCGSTSTGRPRGRAPSTPPGPLTADRAHFDRLWEERRADYRDAADAIVDGRHAGAAVAAAIAQQVWTRPGALALAESDGRLFRVVDSAVADHVAADLVLEGGEGEKSAAGLERLWRAFAEAGLERRDRVLAVGGGAVTDVVGFAAATFRRGIGWIAGPTTLVGQVDAAIGGKTAIDVAAKNDVGAFWSPQSVLADPDLLESLPQREWAAGYAECAKTALLAGGPLWDLVRQLGAERPSAAAQAELVRRWRDSRALVVAQDPARVRPARDPQPRAHGRARHRVGCRLRGAPPRRGGLDRPRRGAAALGASRGPGSRHRRRGRAAARRAGAADACAGPRPGRGARGDAARQEARARRPPLRAARAGGEAAGRRRGGGRRAVAEAVATAVSGRE